jgi:hypothetical protein
MDRMRAIMNRGLELVSEFAWRLTKPLSPQVGAPSELLIMGGQTIHEAKDQVAKLERVQAERCKLGHE